LLRYLLAVFVLVQAAGCATRGQARPRDYEGYFGTYPSGLRLVVYGYPESGGVSALHVSYLMSVVDEPPGQEGIRELARRLSLLTRPEGPGSPTLGEHFEASRSAGGSGVGIDEVFFTTLNSTLQLSRLLEFEALRMREPLAHVTEAEFIEARDVLARELHQRNPTSAPQALMRAELFADHPYGKQLPGTEASVRALTLEAVRAWARAHYTPDRAVLVVMGAVPPKEVANAVTASFGALVAGPVAKARVPTPPPLPERLPRGQVVKRPAPVGYPQLWVVWRAPGSVAGQHAEAAMMADYLRTGVLPWVTPMVKGSLAKEAQAGIWAAEGTTLIYLMLEVGHGEDLAPLVDKVKDRLSFSWGAMMGGSTAMTQRQRGYAQALREVEQISPGEVAWYLRTTGKADVQGLPLGVAAMPVSHIRGYARDYLRAEQATFLLLVPPEDMELQAPPEI